MAGVKSKKVPDEALYTRPFPAPCLANSLYVLKDLCEEGQSEKIKRFATAMCCNLPGPLRMACLVHNRFLKITVQWSTADSEEITCFQLRKLTCKDNVQKLLRELLGVYKNTRFPFGFWNTLGPGEMYRCVVYKRAPSVFKE